MSVNALKGIQHPELKTTERKKSRNKSINRQCTKEKIRVGIPRALLYYKFYPLWITFFEELGVKVVVSPPTNKEIKNLAISTAPDEDCYSTKLYYGHVMYLKDKVDYLFIPRFQSEHKTNVSCPKFMGLAESLRSMYPNLPPLIMPSYSTAKLGHGEWTLIKIAISIGKLFNKNITESLRALRNAFRIFTHWKQDKWLTMKEFTDWKEDKFYVNEPPVLESSLKTLKIALVGHPYMINDPYASLNMKKQLIDTGVNVITSEQFPRDLIEKQMDTLDFNMFFDYERELLGTVMHFLEEQTVDGIIHIIIFSCGPDSVAGEMVNRFSNRKPTIPVLQLTFDELTGEAGLKTRLEAFIDMVRRKKTAEKKSQCQ
ncbi:MAG: acyl-CoA dehydratase activase-related protein [Promethearchaeota archaeon]